MRSASLVAVAVLTLVIFAMPAQAYINILQNPSFETGSLDPWVMSGATGWRGGIGSGGGHEGTHFAWMDAPTTGYADLFQNINPAQCAEYVEFWYRSIAGGVNVGVYADGDQLRTTFPETASYEWTRVHIDLDTTKTVHGLDILIGDGTSIDVDDFDLEACGGAPVGGLAMPANTLALVAPWLAVIALVGCIGIVAVIVKKRK